jgi:hypothetical protein
VDTVKNQSITSLPRSPYDDRRARMIKYSLAMGIRMICILSLLFVQGWWLVIMATGAIVLPYIAVVLANVGANPGAGVESPGGREVMLRNPQTPIIIPAAEESPAGQPGSQSAGPRFEQDFQEPYEHGFAQPSDQGFEQRPAQEPPFPRPAHGPFAQPAGSSSAHPYEPSDVDPAGQPPADRLEADRLEADRLEAIRLEEDQA